jgi:hypothetical protein
MRDMVKDHGRVAMKALLILSTVFFTLPPPYYASDSRTIKLLLDYERPGEVKKEHALPGDVLFEAPRADALRAL